ncbi:type II toxin-antitoxin system VapC family toxin [Hoyosella subflava]|uniref:PilT protein domain protein n=1 Tax=Hoyosella subflava (strain DSM 45089 / JCM 17490 / NBRC 109087 / DQS3-9A1) TaxID=443218 RepID=F6ESM9_HOYSD|nr:type II toxin-antitoxin system VapC family toxin [Hoyosella subflava]AEF43150.1 PilT protein domain protein [Hoyosella subflava DQS3-9A1]
MITRTVLLDTNALLWLTAAPEKMSPQVLELLATPSTELVVSAASAWEVSIKTSTGKLPGGHALLSVWGETIIHLRAETLAIDSADAIMAGALPWPHRDPFDRMLITQAARRALTLATSDPTMIQGALSPTIDTRSDT